MKRLLQKILKIWRKSEDKAMVAHCKVYNPCKGLWTKITVFKPKGKPYPSKQQIIRQLAQHEVCSNPNCRRKKGRDAKTKHS